MCQKYIPQGASHRHSVLLHVVNQDSREQNINCFCPSLLGSVYWLLPYCSPPPIADVVGGGLPNDIVWTIPAFPYLLGVLILQVDNCWCFCTTVLSWRKPSGTAVWEHKPELSEVAYNQMTDSCEIQKPCPWPQSGASNTQWFILYKTLSGLRLNLLECRDHVTV